MAEEYIAKPHIIRPHAPLRSKGLIHLKVYTMHSVGSEDVEAEQYSRAGMHVIAEIGGGRVDKRLGLGFLVVSRGVANLGLWGGQYPSLLNQTIYEFNPEELEPVFEKKRVEEVGSFCCWELGVVAHEGSAWRRYLLSPKTQLDREAYLKDRFEGIVG